MNFKFNQSTPLYLQIANQLEEMIFIKQLNEGDQIPSTTQLSRELKINPATILKGINILVAQDLLEKKRGIGMFVKHGAQAIITKKRQESFYHDYVKSLIEESKNLGITKEQLIKLIERGY